MKDLATLGSILRSDTVWKDGVEKGVLASKVKYLFTIPSASVIVSVQKVTALSKPATAPAAPPSAVEPAAGSQERPVAAAPKPALVQKPAQKGKAVATKGAEIISQDGLKAKYRRICTVCKQKDVSVQTIVISNKTTNSGFYCPKCKKRRDVTIHCTLR